VQLLNFLHQNPVDNKVSNLLYRYSGSAEIDYTYMDNELSLVLDQTGRFNLSYRGEGKKQSLGSFIIENEEERNKEVVLIPNNSEFLSKLIEVLGDPQCREGLSKSGSTVAVAKEIINSCVNDVFSEILWDGGKIRLRKEYRDGSLSYIHMNDLGEGIKKAAVIALALEYFRPKLLLWDDFEGAAHPALLKRVMEWLAEKDWQIVMCTHSIDVLKNIIEISPEDAQVIICKKDNEDVLYHHAFDMEAFEKLFYSNADPRMLVDDLGL